MEARAVARLKDPGLVAIYDQGHDGPRPFLVMELVEGGTLRELLRERGPMPPHAVVAVLRPVLSGLAVAHRAGLVHRDVKPENVLISDDGEVKLVDFGLVRAIAEAGITSTSVMRRTGLKKWMPQNRVGSRRGSARWAIGLVEVLVAITVPGPTVRSISTSTCRLMSARSSTLSMTRSHSAIAAIRVAVWSLPDSAIARAGSVRLVPRSQAASSRMPATLAASVSACTSTSVTAKPARRWLAAIPAPMMPAPMTAGRSRGG